MRITFVERGAPIWISCAELVQEVFFNEYQVTARPNPDYFLAYVGEDKNGAEQVLACAGFTFPENGPMYLERYFDQPIEEVVSAAEGEEIERSQILQIGSIASIRAYAGAEIIKAVPFVLVGLGYSYAALTANTKLAGVMGYLGIAFHHLTDADPRRLDAEELPAWGSYYDSNPIVGYANLTENLSLLVNGIGRYRLDSIDLRVFGGNVRPHRAKRNRELAHV